MSRIKGHLKINEFKSDLNSIDFGRIYLFPFGFNPFKSQILNDGQSLELIKMCEFNKNHRKYTLLYRGSRDGLTAWDFHSKCDNKSPTLTIIKPLNSANIFGAYTEATWSSSSNEFKSDPNAFIFSLTNKDNLPCKMKTSYAGRSIKCCMMTNPWRAFRGMRI